MSRRSRGGRSTDLFLQGGSQRLPLEDPNYSTLRLRLENAHAAEEAAAVEVRRRVRMNEEDAKRR